MLNELIRKYRRARNMTQEQLAEAMGVSAASVSKWETGQAAPELTVLMELADFFEVSVDTLLGHTVKGDRKAGLLGQMQALSDAEKHEEARALAEKLLRCYPNDAEVVEKAAHVYYDCFILFHDRAHMEQAIALTKRLFTLAEDKTGMKRFELLSTLGNQYENLQEWETARKYYREGNVGKLNDRSLARLLANEGRDKEAVEAISKVFFNSFYEMICDTLLLEQSWKKLDQPEKAAGALTWGLNAIDGLGRMTRQELAPLADLMRSQREELETCGEGEFLAGITAAVVSEENPDEKGKVIIRLNFKDGQVE